MRYLPGIIILAVMAGCTPETGTAPTQSRVEVVKTDSDYQLLRGGEPYVIRGAGMGIDDIDLSGLQACLGEASR